MGLKTNKVNSIRAIGTALLAIITVILMFWKVFISNVPFSSYGDGSLSIARPLEDYYNLSFRPWYFVIPPKSSLFFSDISKSLYKKIESTNYYLADDYMEEEMAGSYMGIHFILGMIFILVLLMLEKTKNIKYPIFNNIYLNKELIIKSYLMIFLILLISGPPSFTIRGIEIYTPTYLLYYIVPVFRTLVRWAVVIYLFVLIINSFLVSDLYNLCKTKLSKFIFIISFLILNFVIFAIKIPVIDLNNPPSEITFMKNISSETYTYAVYPVGDYYSIFWVISHQKYLLNPMDFINKETGFDSNTFSKNLITIEGIEELKKTNTKYLVYYMYEVNPKKLNATEIKDFFELNFGNIVYNKDRVVIYEKRQ